MVLRLAFRNIINNGWRSLINVVVIAIVLIIMVWTQAMYYSWIRLAETQQKEWEYGGGMLRVKSYDPYDAFSLEDAHAPLNMVRLLFSHTESIWTPVLLAPASIYPEGRMMSAVLKGMPTDQQVLKFPSHLLQAPDGDMVPVVIGQSMAKSSRLSEGDIFSIRVRDINGTFNAIDAIVKAVIFIPAPSVDVGSVWMNYDTLNELRGLKNAASYVVMDEWPFHHLGNFEMDHYRYIGKAEYFADLYQMLENERFQQILMYALLVFLAMIAVFDTQALAVFKRRKEIGTLSALGFTKGKIALLFTLEGVFYTFFAIVLTPILGFPLFWYYATTGFKIPPGYDEFGIQGFSEAIKFQYPLDEIFWVFIIMLLFTAVVSWLPTLKIARMNPVDALRGKVN